MLDKINSWFLGRGRVTAYDSEELTALELMGKLAGKTNELIDETNKKVSQGGDFRGTWHGLRPSQTNESVTSLVDDIDQKVNGIKDKVSSVVNVLTFGAGTTKTAIENSLAFQNAINSMVEGDTLLIPKGSYDINNVVFNPPNYCRLKCEGRLVSRISNGITFRIGDLDSARLGYDIKGLRVETGILNWGSIVTGVQVVNCYDSMLGIARVFGFYKNIECLGTNGHGLSYNKFFIGRSDGGKKSIFLTSNSGGWCNENVFLGGEFSFVSSNGVLDNSCVLITIDHNPTSDLNNNHFIAPSLEGNTSKKGLAALIEGTFNTIENARMEWIESITLTNKSQYNRISIAYDDYKLDRVVDSGQGNTIITRRRTRLNSAFDEPFTVQNQGSDNNKNFVSKDTGDITRWFVTAGGRTFSSQHGYYQNGIRFMTTDGTFTDRGLFMGTGSPEGVVPAQPGSLYVNINGGVSTLFVKQSGAGATGWVAK